MRRLIVSPAANHDIDLLLETSEGRFGAAAANRYRALIGATIDDLLSDPERPAARGDTRLSPAIRLYHLRHANRRLRDDLRVGDPRHFLLFRFTRDTLEIVRVLHDAMDLPRHVVGD